MHENIKNEYGKQKISDSLRARTNPFAVAGRDVVNEKRGSLWSSQSTNNSYKKRTIHYNDDTPMSFVIPKKHKINYDRDLDKAQERSESIDKTLKEDMLHTEKLTCPFCFTVFPTMTTALQNALDKMELKNKRYKETIKKQEEDSSFHKPDSIINRPISHEEKDDFCRLHRIELVVKPQGKKKGYPEKIRFELLRYRIKALIPELEKVISNETESEYRQIAIDAYEELGANKARSSIAVMARFEALLPGYYGPKGASLISDILTDIFLDTLTPKQVSPQKPQEYIQQVLIPETAYRLIKEDYFVIDDQEAKDIMKESTEYGELMNPLNE